MNSQPIGIFDSGVGGLSVLKELVKLMPKEHYLFVADQINVPYGEKTNKELEEKTLKICDFLISKKTKIIIVACNTVTCNVIDFLRNKELQHALSVIICNDRFKADSVSSIIKAFKKADDPKHYGKVLIEWV